MVGIVAELYLGGANGKLAILNTSNPYQYR